MKIVPIEEPFEWRTPLLRVTAHVVLQIGVGPNTNFTLLKQDSIELQFVAGKLSR
jgi:hypothetical protein